MSTPPSRCAGAAWLEAEAWQRALWRRVLPDTWLSDRLADRFYDDPGRALRWLGKPFVWRALVRGYARGATLLLRSQQGRRLAARSTVGMDDGAVEDVVGVGEFEVGDFAFAALDNFRLGTFFVE